MKRFCLPAMLSVLLLAQLTGTTMAGDAASYTPPGTYSNSNVDMHGYGITNASQVQTNILYDRDNTGYYIDPSGNSNVFSIYSNWMMASTFYDRDNSSYFVNPAGTTKLAALTLGGVTKTSWPSSGNCRICLSMKKVNNGVITETCDNNPFDTAYSPWMWIGDGTSWTRNMRVRIVCD